MGSAGVAGETLTPAQVAEMFNVSPRTVSRWVREGKLRGFRTPGGVNRFRRSEIEALRDVCHRCGERPATAEGILCDECRATEAAAS